MGSDVEFRLKYDLVEKECLCRIAIYLLINLMLLGYLQQPTSHK